MPLSHFMGGGLFFTLSNFTLHKKTPVKGALV